MLQIRDGENEYSSQAEASGMGESKKVGFLKVSC